MNISRLTTQTNKLNCTYSALAVTAKSTSVWTFKFRGANPAETKVSTLTPSGLTDPAFWWWLSPASPGSVGAERHRRRGRPSPEREPGRYLCPEAARPADTTDTWRNEKLMQSTEQ